MPTVLCFACTSHENCKKCRADFLQKSFFQTNLFETGTTEVQHHMFQPDLDLHREAIFWWLLQHQTTPLRWRLRSAFSKLIKHHFSWKTRPGLEGPGSRRSEGNHLGILIRLWRFPYVMGVSKNNQFTWGNPYEMKTGGTPISGNHHTLTIKMDMN